MRITKCHQYQYTTPYLWSLLWPDEDREGYTQQMLNCLSLHSDSGTNGMLGYSDKSIEKHGKKQDKIFRKIYLKTPNLNYSIAIHTSNI